MPPRFAFWTILIDGKPTAFRARERDELVPTFQQLRRTNKDVVLKWFARGRLWETPEEAQAAQRAPKRTGEKRGSEWRPGGGHADPRARFKKKLGEPPSGGPPRRDRPWSGKPPSGGPPRRDRPWGSKPPSGQPPRGDRRDRTTSKTPSRDMSRGSRPWSKKPSGARFRPRDERPPREERPPDRRESEAPPKPRPDAVPEPPKPEQIVIKPEPPERG
ncbi:MAG: hypothetical protein DMF91_16190 [Acidobacteria bacterium]|nr:MAG: hypothetical protein DMF91_16190 [Acidobacteriota bacterium]